MLCTFKALGAMMEGRCACVLPPSHHPLISSSVGRLGSACFQSGAGGGEMGSLLSLASVSCGCFCPWCSPIRQGSIGCCLRHRAGSKVPGVGLTQAWCPLFSAWGKLRL